MRPTLDPRVDACIAQLIVPALLDRLLRQANTPREAPRPDRVESRPSA